MNKTLATLASICSIVYSKSITLDMYRSHARTKDGQIIPVNKLGD
jgi:hypothetical protein